MRRFLLSLPWAALAYGAPLSVGHAAAVNECLQVAPEVAPAGISLQLHNTCDFDLRCELTWRVRCDGDPADAPPRVHNVALRLISAASKLLFASGEACGANIWEITDEAWSCKQVL